MADFTIVGDTKLDTGKVKAGLRELSGAASAGLKGVTVAAGLAGAALSAAQVAAMKFGSEYETSLAKLSTIADTNKKSMQDFSAELLDLSDKTGVAAKDLAETAYNAISAGTDTTKAVGMVESATKLAVAGFTDSNSALSVLTTSINAYGDAAGSASEISDSLIQTQNLGVTTVAELASNMGKAIATGSAYGINLRNVESGYISLTKNGISTAESTTYLASMFKELGDGGSNIAKIIRTQTGKSFGQLMKEGKSLADVLGIVYDSVGQNSEALMNLWGSAEAGKASNAIINQGLSTFNDNLKTLTETTGITESAYSKMTDTFSFKSKVALNGVKNLAISLYADLQEGAKSGVDVINKYIDKIKSAMAQGRFDSMRKSIKALGDIMAKVLDKALAILGRLAMAGIPIAVNALHLLAKAALLVLTTVQRLEPLLWAVVAALVAYKILGTISNLMTNFNRLQQIIIYLSKIGRLTTMLETGALTTKAIVVGVLTGQIKLATLAQMAWNAVMNANPLMWVVAGVGLLVGALVLLHKNCDSVISKEKEMLEESKKLKEEAKEVSKSAKEMASSWQETADTLEAQGAFAQRLVNELEQLSAKTQKSSADKERMARIVDQLNSMYPDLALSINKETGELSKSIPAIKEAVTAKIALAKAMAAQEMIAEITKKQVEVEIKKGKAMEKASDAAEALGKKEEERDRIALQSVSTTDGLAEGYVKYAGKVMRADEAIMRLSNDESDLKKAQENAKTSVKEYQKTLDGYEKKIGDLKDYAEAHMSANEEVAASTQEAASSIDGANASIDASEQQKAEAMREASEKIESSIKSQINLFEEAAQKDSISKEQMLANMQKNLSDLQSWREGLTSLMQRTSEDGTRILSDGLLQHLAEMGPQGASYIAAMGQMTDEELKAANEMWSQSMTFPQETARELAQFGVEASSAMADSTGQIASATQNTIQQGVASGASAADTTASTTAAGANAVNSTANAIKENTGQVQAAGVAMGQAVGAGFSSGLSGSYLSSLASSAIGQMVEAINGYSSKVSAAGTQLGNSFANGLRSANLQGNTTPLIHAALANFMAAITGKYMIANSSGRMLGNYVVTGLRSSNMQGQLQLIGQAAVQALINQLNAGGESLKSAGANAANSVLSGLRSVDLHGNAYNTGVHFCNGLAGGINSNRYAVEAAARAAAKAASDAANAQLQIHSPSRVAEKTGKWYDLGLAGGMQENQRFVEMAGRSLGQAVADSTRIPLADLPIAQMGAYRLWTNTQPQTPTDTVIHQDINVYQPLKSPIEMAQAARRVAKELAYG